MNKLLITIVSVCLSVGSLSSYYDYSYYDSNSSASSFNSYDSSDTSSTFNSYAYSSDQTYNKEEPSLGQTVQSPTKNYTLIRELGAGAFGKVFEATTDLNENFALKWYMSGGFSGWFGDRLADHNREFMLGQVLDHPNIIKSVESFADKQASNYTVLEFVPGKTLASTSRGSLELSEAIAATKQFVSGIRHAFAQEYLHLDLHGNNIMVSQNHEVKIIDLSSFFSFQEIRDHCATSEKSSSSTYQNPAAHKKAAKIEQFCKRHPALKALKNAYTDKTATPISHFVVRNFDDITEICIRVMLRAKLTREERLNIRADLKKISWNCDADLEEGKTIHFEEYLDSIDALLNSFVPQAEESI